ncbi:MAG: alpha/beta fold hydrolase [Burkholderiales bacterium]
MGFFISVEPDVKLFVEDLNPQGRKTILFVHGWPGNHKLFEYQFDVFPGMGCRCIGIDYRGFGKSDRPWTGYDYDQLSDDLLCVVSKLRLTDFTLVGHSTGGAICVRYMARHGGYGVGKLALCAAAAPSLIKRPYFPYGLPRQSVIDIIENTYADRPNMLRSFGNMIFHNPVSEALYDWIFGLGLQASGWATAAIANTWLNEEQLFSDLKTINVPTIILHGLQDKVCLFPLAIAQRDSIPGSRLVSFENCGHFLFIDRREAFNNELMRFVNE